MRTPQIDRSPAREAIAFLIEQAQTGAIDPWDVRVIEIIDRFLSELGLIGERTTLADCFTNLPQSGQAFLWASMLVLLKADTLEKTETEIAPDPEVPQDNEASLNGERRSLPKHLEQHLRPRGSAPPPRKRRVTLPELIEQIEKIARELEGKTSNKSSRRDRRLSRAETARAITQLAHNENLTEVAAGLEKFLALDLPQLAPSQSSIDFEQLLEWWTNLAPPSSDLTHSQPVNTTKDRVGVFWALLLLSAQSKVELSQAEFYQDLKIEPVLNRNLQTPSRTSDPTETERKSQLQ